jgi:hypothetical protein
MLISIREWTITKLAQYIQQLQYNIGQYKNEKTEKLIIYVYLHLQEVIKQRSTIYQNKIEGHVNVLIQPLLQPHNQRRLKRNWPADLQEG